GATLQATLAVVGCVLLAIAFAAGRPGPASGARAATMLRVSMSSDVDYVDPALDYLSTGWEIQYATACKLLNYADRAGPPGSRPPRGAAGSPQPPQHGKTYTCTPRRASPCAKGAPAPAASFALAFNRNANPSLQSPAESFMQDIVGANSVTRGLSRS